MITKNTMNKDELPPPGSPEMQELIRLELKRREDRHREALQMLEEMPIRTDLIPRGRRRKLELTDEEIERMPLTPEIEKHKVEVRESLARMDQEPPLTLEELRAQVPEYYKQFTGPYAKD